MIPEPIVPARVDERPGAVPGVGNGAGEKPVEWFYLDPGGRIQGPFTSDTMRRWWQQGKLPKNLLITLTKDVESLRQVAGFFPDLKAAFTGPPMTGA
jgi:hypothetical protein